MTMSDSFESDAEFEEVENQEVQDEQEQDEQREERPKHRSNHIDFDKDFEGVNPEVVKKVRSRIDEDFRKNKEIERQSKEAQRKIRELENQMLEMKKPKEVKLPSADLAIENPEEFQRQQAAYNESIKAQADYEYQRKERESLIRAEQERERQEQVGIFAERAKNAGVDMNQAAMAAQIAMNELPQELHGFLAYHESAPQLLVRLASNPLEMKELASLSIAEAAVKLDRMAASFKKSTKSKAPPPIESLKGSVASVDDYDGALKGGKFL